MLRVLLLPSINLEASDIVKIGGTTVILEEAGVLVPFSWALLGEKNSKPEAGPRIIRQQVNADVTLKERASGYCLCPALPMYDVSISFWSSSGVVMEPNSRSMTIPFNSLAVGIIFLKITGITAGDNGAEMSKRDKRLQNYNVDLVYRRVPFRYPELDSSSLGQLQSPKQPAQVMTRYGILKCICIAFSPLYETTLIRRSIL